MIGLVGFQWKGGDPAWGWLKLAQLEAILGPGLGSTVAAG